MEVQCSFDRPLLHRLPSLALCLMLAGTISGRCAICSASVKAPGAYRWMCSQSSWSPRTKTWREGSSCAGAYPRHVQHTPDLSPSLLWRHDCKHNCRTEAVLLSQWLDSWIALLDYWLVKFPQKLFLKSTVLKTKYIFRSVIEKQIAGGNLLGQNGSIGSLGNL